MGWIVCGDMVVNCPDAAKDAIRVGWANAARQPCDAGGFDVLASGMRFVDFALKHGATTIDAPEGTYTAKQEG